MCRTDPAPNGVGERAADDLVVNDADACHSRMLDAGLTVTPITEQPWGMREFAFDDPSGNHIRIGRAIPSDTDDRRDGGATVGSGASTF